MRSVLAFLVLACATGLAAAELPHLRQQGTATQLIVYGQWQHLCWLNGDQTHQGRHVRLEPVRFTQQRVKLYRYR